MDGASAGAYGACASAGKTDRVFLVRYAEVGLKGGNRPYFEKLLLTHIRKATRAYGASSGRIHGRILVSCSEDSAKDVARALADVPGIQNFSEAVNCSPDLETWQRLILENLSGLNGCGRPVSFRIRAQRADKSFPMKSPEIEARLGAAVLEHFGRERFSVDLDEPEADIGIEVMSGRSFLFMGKTEGVGGLPVGSSGRVLCLMSGGIDSPVAAFQMIRRGCRADFVFFENSEFMGRAAGFKVRRLAAILDRYQLHHKLRIVPFGEIQSSIRDCCEERHRVIIYRRFMYRISERLMGDYRCLGLVTGESLGQVASQTLENLAATQAVVRACVYRPLIGMDKLDIMKLARRLGTYETSIEDAQDCCSAFLPRRPATRADLARVSEDEGRLDVEGLTGRAIAASELCRVEDVP